MGSGIACPSSSSCSSASISNAVFFGAAFDANDIGRGALLVVITPGFAEEADATKDIPFAARCVPMEDAAVGSSKGRFVRSSLSSSLDAKKSFLSFLASFTGLSEGMG